MKWVTNGIFESDNISRNKLENETTTLTFIFLKSHYNPIDIRHKSNLTTNPYLE